MLQAHRHEIVAYEYRNDDESVLITRYQTPCAKEILTRAPSCHAGVANRDRLTDRFRKPLLQQSCEALFVFYLERFHEGVAEEQDGHASLDATRSAYAEPGAVGANRYCSLSCIHLGLNIRTAQPPDSVGGLPDVRPEHDQLLGGGQPDGHFGRNSSEEQRPGEERTIDCSRSCNPTKTGRCFSHYRTDATESWAAEGATAPGCSQ
jgi:hypothetical protein